MDVRQIRYFVAVASEGSFSKAAARLHMTQPPLSTNIAMLERSLGVELLERKPHGVVPTAAGEYLQRTGAQLLTRIDEIERHLTGLGAGLEGHLVIASVPTFTWEFMPPTLARFAQQCPNVDITLYDPPPQLAIDMVLGGDVDLAVVVTSNTHQLRNQYKGTLNVEAVEELPLVAVLPSTLSVDEFAVDLLDLRDQQWIVPMREPRFPGLPELLEQVWHSLQGIAPSVREVSTLQTALPLVAAGLGVGLVPRSVRHVGHPELVIREIVQDIPPMEAAVLWRQAHQSPTMERFLEVLRGPWK